MMSHGQVLTITGPAGAGKTTLVNGLLAHYGDKVQPLVRVTTRAKRADDNVAEYRYVTRREFQALQGQGELLYPIQIHDVWHAMERKSVARAFAGEYALTVADLSVRSVENLYCYARSINRADKLVSVFLGGCSEEVLRARMAARKETAIDERIEACRQWEKMARNSSVSFVFIDAGVAAEAVLRRTIKLLDSFP